MRRLTSCSIILLLLISGCGRQKFTQKPARTANSPDSSRIRLVSVGAKAGIHFRLGHQGRTPLNILETSGGGCAFLDYDGDGWPDILLVGPHNVALYHNEHNGTFKDVTAQSGLDTKSWWMGCAVGDYSGDGMPDIFLTGYHCCALYQNRGGGKFKDVTRESGISGLEWSMSAVFADLSGHGRLDLFVSQYVHFDATTPQICAVGNTRSACGPEMYSALSGKLFINEDGHHFKAASWKDSGKTWGTLVSNISDSGHPSLYLSNDMMPGDLWEKRANQWVNVGPASGSAYDGQGHLQGGMGVDAGDYDNDGRQDLVVTTYFAQPNSLYHNDGHNFFTVTSGSTGIGPPTTPYVGFGVSFADFDNDGWLDLILANGHVRDNVHDFDASQTYAQPIQVFRNELGRFAECPDFAGNASVEPIVGRGLSVGDYNRDGREDVLICNLEGDAILLENRSSVQHWIDVRLQSEGMNRSGLGSFLTLRSGAQTQVREIRTCGSVLSAREPAAHFGLGNYSGPVTLQVRWPDGFLQKVEIGKVDAAVTVRRPKRFASRL